MNVPFEYTVKVLSLKQFLPAGPTGNGGVRKQDLVQVWSDPGGLRTLALSEIKLGRRTRGRHKPASAQEDDI
jgi:hypothetical protein